MTLQNIDDAYMPRMHAPQAQATRERATFFDFVAILLFVWHASGAEQAIVANGGPPPILFQLASFAILALIATGRLLAGVSISPGGPGRLFGFTVVVAIYLTWQTINYLYGSMGELASDLLRSKFVVGAFVVLFAHMLSGPRVSRPFSVACAFLACAAALLNVYDLVTATFSTTAGRAAGFYLNPNIAGFMIPCLGLMGMRGLSTTGRHVVWAIVTVGAVLTFSRATYMFVVLATLWLTWLGYLGTRSHRYLFAGLVLPLLVAFVFALTTGALYDVIAASPLAGYLNENAIQRLGGASASILANDSTTERANVAAEAFRIFELSPLFGHGFASTFEWKLSQSTHNMYLLALAEGGILGLIAYLTLIGYVILRTYDVYICVAAILVIQGVFNHNIMDDLQQALVVGAMAAAVAGRGRAALRQDQTLRAEELRGA